MCCVLPTCRCLGTINFGQPVRAKALKSSLILLCHRYPKIRRLTGEQFYTMLLTFDDILEDEDKLDDALMILSETAWDSPLPQVRPERNKLCEIFGVPVPKTKKKVKVAATENKNKDAVSTYADFIHSIGR